MGTHYIYRKAVTANHAVTGTNLEADGSGYYEALTIKIYCKTTGTNDITYTAGSFLTATSLYGWVQTTQMLQTQDLSFVYTLCGTTPTLKGSSTPVWKVLQASSPTAQLTISATADSAGTSEQTYNAANTVATFTQTALPYLKIVSTNSLSMSAAGITKVFNFGIDYTSDLEMQASSDDCATGCTDSSVYSQAENVVIKNPCYTASTVVTETEFNKAHLEPYGMDNALISRIYTQEDLWTGPI